MSNLNIEGINNMVEDRTLRAESKHFFNRLCTYKYSYNFTWMGRPIIQFPHDCLAGNYL